MCQLLLIDCVSVIFSSTQAKGMLKKNLYFGNPQRLKELLTTL